jgi:hypothetical protein
MINATFITNPLWRPSSTHHELTSWLYGLISESEVAGRQAVVVEAKSTGRVSGKGISKDKVEGIKDVLKDKGKRIKDGEKGRVRVRGSEKRRVRDRLKG